MSKHDAGKPEQPAREAWLGEQGRKPRRRRVVLADSTKPRGKALRTIIELEEQTSVGEKLVRDLIKQQLKSAFGLAFAVLIGMCLLPVAFYFFRRSGIWRSSASPFPGSCSVSRPSRSSTASGGSSADRPKGTSATS